MSRPWGLLAEFDTPERLLDAARRTREAGFGRLDACTPMPVHGLFEALGGRRTRLPWLVFLGGLAGGVAGFALQYWVSVVEYPVNVGGRPLNSWPAFVVVTFETAILAAALSAVFGMFVLNGLPRPYHPLFNVDSFVEHASRDRFYLVVEAGDGGRAPAEARAFLEDLNPLRVYEVDP